MTQKLIILVLVLVVSVGCMPAPKSEGKPFPPPEEGFLPFPVDSGHATKWWLKNPQCKEVSVERSELTFVGGTGWNYNYSVPITIIASSTEEVIYAYGHILLRGSTTHLFVVGDGVLGKSAMGPFRECPIK